MKRNKKDQFSDFIWLSDEEGHVVPSVDFTLEKVSTGVKISWDEVDGASAYRIFRKGAGA